MPKKLHFLWLHSKSRVSLSFQQIMSNMVRKPRSTASLFSKLYILVLHHQLFDSLVCMHHGRASAKIVATYHQVAKIVAKTT